MEEIRLELETKDASEIDLEVWKEKIRSQSKKRKEWDDRRKRSSASSEKPDTSRQEPSEPKKTVSNNVDKQCFLLTKTIVNDK